MSCHHCVMAVRRELEKLPLESMDVKLGQAEVSFDETKLAEGQIGRCIEDAGYKVQPIK